MRLPGHQVWTIVAAHRGLTNPSAPGNGRGIGASVGDLKVLSRAPDEEQVGFLIP